jgi:hypothetical protein
MERFEGARSNLLLAGEAVHALFLREDSEEAELGALIVAAGSLVWIAPRKR